MPRVLVILLSPIVFFIAQPTIAANAALGAEIFKQCAACHAIGPGADHSIGPTLNHVFGRIAGQADGFEYSDGMKSKSLDNHIWHEKTLYKFLANPAKRVPGTTMAFAGLKTEKEIKNLLAYLIQFSPAYKPKSRKIVPEATMRAAAVPRLTTTKSNEPENPDFSDQFLASSNAILSGENLWAAQCRHCHGSAAYPGKAPKLIPHRYAADFVFDRVTNGFKKMPAWKHLFTMQERMDLVAYILSKKFSP